jgi:hypothetical protein
MKNLITALKDNIDTHVRIDADARGETIAVLVGDNIYTFGDDIEDVRAISRAVDKNAWIYGMNFDTATIPVHELLFGLIKDTEIVQPLKLQQPDGGGRILISPTPDPESFDYFVELFAPDSDEPYTWNALEGFANALKWALFEANDELADLAYCEARDEARDYAEF